jgi:hypothetical protein
MIEARTRREILFNGDVSFERGGQRATSNWARFTGADQLLRLSDDLQLSRTAAS